jgi:hypothetical protein
LKIFTAPTTLRMNHGLAELSELVIITSEASPQTIEACFT